MKELTEKMSKCMDDNNWFRDAVSIRSIPGPVINRLGVDLTDVAVDCANRAFSEPLMRIKVYLGIKKLVETSSRGWVLDKSMNPVQKLTVEEAQDDPRYDQIVG